MIKRVPAMGRSVAPCDALQFRAEPGKLADAGSAAGPACREGPSGELLGRKVFDAHWWFALGWRPMGSGQKHSGAHLIDDDLVRRLVAGQFPQWAGLPLQRYPSGGTVNAMYRLGDSMVVRLPLVNRGARDVVMEQQWLPRLAPLLPTAIPEVLGAGDPAEGYPCPWAVYRWLAGENPEPGALRDPALLAKDLAEFVAAMRAVTLPGAPQAHRGGPLASLDTSTRAAIEALRDI